MTFVFLKKSKKKNNKEYTQKRRDDMLRESAGLPRSRSGTSLHHAPISSASNDNGFHATLPLHSTSGDKYQRRMRKKKCAREKQQLGLESDFGGICFSARVFERVLLQSDESGKRGA